MAKSEEIKNKTDLTLLPDFFSFLFFFNCWEISKYFKWKIPIFEVIQIMIFHIMQSSSS